MLITPDHLPSALADGQDCIVLHDHMVVVEFNHMGIVDQN